MVIVNNFTHRWYSYPQIKSLFPPQQNTNNVRIKKPRLATYIYDVQEVEVLSNTGTTIGVQVEVR